jgi:hypothetical protein
MLRFRSKSHETDFQRYEVETKPGFWKQWIYLHAYGCVIFNFFYRSLLHHIFTHIFLFFLFICSCLRGRRSWLRHCATSRKVAASIPDGVIGIFHWHNLSGRTMALRSTQPLKEMSTRNIFWAVKAAGAYGWQPYRFLMPQPSETLRASPGLYRDCFTFIFLLPPSVSVKKYLAVFEMWQFWWGLYILHVTILALWVRLCDFLPAALC